jgi:glutathione S-transferase
VKLFYSPGACSLAPHIVLYELGRPFEVERVVIANGDHLKPEYLKINPRGRVPTLLVDGTVIRENSAILTWLGQQGAGLFPPLGSLPAAHASEWLAWLTSALHISFAQIWRGLRFSDDATQHAAIRARGLSALAEQFEEIEGALVGKRYVLGDTYSVVDANLLPFFRWGSRMGFPMRSRFPNWTCHTERMLERDAVRRTIAVEGINMWPTPDAWVADGQGTMTHERLAAFDSAWTRADVDGLMSFVTPDIVYAASVGPEPGSIYRGADEVRRGFETMLANDAGRVRRSGPSWIFGDIGIGRWSFAEGGRVIEGIDLFEFAGDRIRRKDAFRKALKG